MCLNNFLISVHQQEKLLEGVGLKQLFQEALLQEVEAKAKNLLDGRGP